MSGLVLEERDGRVEAEHLLHGALEAGELVEVTVVDFPVEADDPRQFLLRSFQLFGALHSAEKPTVVSEPGSNEIKRRISNQSKGRDD
ncbi:hypothetical protein B296_00001424 [Ensete ventricosum]|uniref:Uncharacterized protein n=1 Tax=Ensete ventricosum TaxID=4639 RepID=A0A427ADT5_ENSVE|nr:hypothetical protein B296_00001424 [Ensete ventricosum]